MIQWTIAPQHPLSWGFSRHECWSPLPFLFPEDLSDPGMEPATPAKFLTLQADFLNSEPQGKPGESTGDLLKLQSPGQVPGKLDHKDSYRACSKSISALFFTCKFLIPLRKFGTQINI